MIFTISNSAVYKLILCSEFSSEIKEYNDTVIDI